MAESGKHTHLNGGAGLANRAGGGNEPGWDAINWNTPTNLPTDKGTWDGSLGCSTTYQTWTADSGPNETKPIRKRAASKVTGKRRKES